jgi:hypothetical protein
LNQRVEPKKIKKRYLTTKLTRIVYIKELYFKDYIVFFKVGSAKRRSRSVHLWVCSNPGVEKMYFIKRCKNKEKITFSGYFFFEKNAVKF